MISHRHVYATSKPLAGSTGRFDGAIIQRGESGLTFVAPDWTHIEAVVAPIRERYDALAANDLMKGAGL